MNKKGRIFVISSPSGGGKTTVALRVLSKTDGLVRSISMTTRAPRPGEKNGADYFFVSKEEFEKIKQGGGFLESAEVFGRQYGTPRKFVEAELARGKDVLLVIDVQGGLQVKRNCPDAELIFIDPPSLEELERRLRERKTDSEESIQTRLNMAREELADVVHYDHVVQNHQDVELAVKDTMNIIRKARAGKA